MFGKLQECVGKMVFIKYWKDGKLCFYAGILNKIVDYKYILIDQKNYLLFLAANGAIASISCDDEVVYESIYNSTSYIPIIECAEQELERREMICFDEEFKRIRYESSLEYFLKWGNEVLDQKSKSTWEEFVRENIRDKRHIIKASVDIANKVLDGVPFYEALVRTFEDTFAFNIKDIEEVNDIILNYFPDTIYEYTDYIEYMLHNARMMRFEEKRNMKQLLNNQDVCISLAN